MFGFDDSYFLYINEAEGTGMVDTKLGRINALIKEMSNHSFSWNKENFDDLCEEYCLDDLTVEEEDMIWERYSENGCMD